MHTCLQEREKYSRLAVNRLSSEIISLSQLFEVLPIIRKELSVMSGIIMPTFVLLPEQQPNFLATAGRPVPDESEKSDESAFLAERLPAGQVPLAATILIPERGPELGEPDNFAYLSSCAMMFCVVQQLPGDRSTIATCSAYTATYGDRPVPEATLLRFPTPDFHIVVRGIYWMSSFLRKHKSQ